MKKFICALLTGFLLIGTSAILSTATADTGVSGAPWKLTARIYSWLPDAPAAIKIGQTPVGNLPEDLDTILEGLQFMSMTEFELSKGPLVLWVAPIYYNGQVHRTLVGPAPGETRRYSVSEKVWLIGYGVGWRFGPWKLSKSENYPMLSLTPIAGFRYFHDPIRVNVPPGMTDPGLAHKTTANFNTPIAGLKTVFEFSDRWSLGLEGDYGVFDADNVKKLWQAIGLVHYKFGTRSELYLGYRYLRLELRDPPDPLEVDLDVKGPLLGYGIRW